MFCLDFLVGVLSFDEGLVRWDQLRRSDDLATIVVTMAVEGIACGSWTAMTLITHHCPFILAFFPTPGAVSEAGKMLECIWVPTNPITLGDSQGGHCPEEFQTFG